MTSLRVALWLAVSSENQGKPDKISLPEQERVGRAWVEAQPDAQLIKVFFWDGYTRSETDVLTAYEDFATQGRFEYHELRQMWQRHEFDVLWVYVHNRLARSAALYAQVMGNVVKSGARIYSHSDGWIDKSNVDTFIAIGGYSSSSEVKNLVNRHEMGMRQRLGTGKMMSPDEPMTHRRVRDPRTGKEVGVIVNEARRRLFDDIATLILEGVGWHDMGTELYQRFGHVADSGKPFVSSTIYNMVMRPATWGHNARRYRSKKKYTGWAAISEWILEPGHDIPKGVEIEYNSLPAVYPDELADRLKTEIKFRMYRVRGRTPSKDKYWFAGLTVCDECGYALSASGGIWPRVKCTTHWKQTHARQDCDQRKSVTEAHLRDWFESRITQMLQDGGWSLRNGNTPQQATDQRDSLKAEIEKLEAEAMLMSRQQRATTNVDYFKLLEKEIDDTMELVSIRKSRLADLDAQVLHRTQSQREGQQIANQIQEKGFAWFWQQNAVVIRRGLLAILDGGRVSIREGKIKQIV